MAYSLQQWLFLLFLALEWPTSTLAQDRIVVHYGNRSFDVTSFVPHHPGGPLVLQHVNGKDVTEYLAGHKAVELTEMGGVQIRHHHSQGAFHILSSLEIQPTEKGKKSKRASQQKGSSKNHRPAQSLSPDDTAAAKH